MKRMHLFILVVFMLLLPVTSSFAVVPGGLATGQQVLLPYATSDAGWWTGLVVTNTSGSDMSFSIGVYKANGDWVSGTGFTVPAHGLKVDSLGSFFPGTLPTGTMSVWIRCSANGAAAFQVTIFVGNPDGGFGIQTVTSWDWVHTTGIILDPHLPVIIPKFPIPILPIM